MLVPPLDSRTDEEVALMLVNARRELTDCLLLATDDTVNLSELLVRIDEQIAALAHLEHVNTAIEMEGDAGALAAEFVLLRERIQRS
jgi:hypothetical protein